jgi:hypothetical protein
MQPYPAAYRISGLCPGQLTGAVENAPPGQTLAIADEKEMVLGSRKRDVGTPQAAEHRATHCSTLLRTKACTRT